MRVDKREQVSTIPVSISVNEAVMFTSIFQLLVVLALLGRILDADWSENDVHIGRGVIFSKWLWVLDCRGAAVRGRQGSYCE